MDYSIEVDIEVVWWRTLAVTGSGDVGRANRILGSCSPRSVVRSKDIAPYVRLENQHPGID